MDKSTYRRVKAYCRNRANYQVVVACCDKIDSTITPWMAYALSHGRGYDSSTYLPKYGYIPIGRTDFFSRKLLVMKLIEEEMEG
jgi:hypothetical protein